MLLNQLLPSYAPGYNPPAIMSDALQNHLEIDSPEQFKEVLGKDLNRVSVINFWATFADPCTQMNQVFLELAKKYPAALFLQVRGPIMS